MSVAVEVACDAHIDEQFEDLPLEFEVLVDGFAVVRGDALQLGRQGTPLDPGSRLQFSKIPVAVQAGTTIGVFVQPAFQQAALIDWGTAGGPVHGIRIGPCGSLDEPGWLVFAGGVWVLELDCVGLIAMTDSEYRPFALPIEQPCTVG